MVVTVGLAVTLAPVVTVSPVLGVQVYVAAPPADIVVEPPEHIEPGPPVVKVGVVFTVTTSVLAVAGQPAAELPLRVYVIVTVGLAVTLAPVDAVKEVFGVHVYVVAPPPVNGVVLPEQMVAGGLIVKVGVVFTVTTTVTGAEGEHPAAVPFNVYV